MTHSDHEFPEEVPEKLMVAINQDAPSPMRLNHELQQEAARHTAARQRHRHAGVT